MSTRDAPDAARDLRVLMPYRLDYFARSMDTTLATMWLALREHCDMVFWGPGFPGYDPARTIDEVEREESADVVLLPDLHHAEPGLWDELLRGVERISCPTALFLSDPLSALDERRDHLRRVHPTAVLGLGPESSYTAYEDLRAELDIELLLRPLGHDPALFFAPEPDTKRDIDVLICGATGGTAYPVRTRIKQAAAQLADTFHVVDVGHPGYWECVSTSPARRGQPSFADMLRRSRLVVTGTTFGILSAKYYEVAACGAVGVGDLPDQIGADDLRSAMLEIGPDDDVSTIAAAMRALLADPDRVTDMARRAAQTAAASTDIHARARHTVDLLAGLHERHVAARLRTLRDARTDRQQLVDAIRVCMPVDPAAPTPRRDWHVLDPSSVDPARDLRALLSVAAKDVCVLAFDPDAANPAEALLLAEHARSTQGIACRPASNSDSVLESGFCCVAVDRRSLLDALDHVHGIAGIEAAIWRLLDTLPQTMLDRPGFDTPAMRARRECGAVDAGIAEALAPREPTLRHRRIPGARVAALDPTDDASLAHVTQLLRAGYTAAPVELGVPVRCGCTLEQAGALLEQHLDSIGLDLEECSDVVVLERLLSDRELAWLEASTEHLGADAAERVA